MMHFVSPTHLYRLQGLPVKNRRPLSSSSARRGSVLILVLWMIIVLGVTGLAYTFSVRNQTAIAESVRNKKEAYWAARAGMEKARAIFSMADLSVVAYNREPFHNEMEENIWNDQWIGHAMYSVGFADESGRVNINTADYDTLMRLPAMTATRAHSLMDWVDKDSRAQAEGAEADYYMELEPPYEPRDGPLTSINELRRVRGWAELFKAAWPDPYVREPEGGETVVSDSGDEEEIDPEQARLLFNAITVWSANPKTESAPDGRDKLDLNSATVDQMKRKVPSMSSSEAQAIVDYRAQKAFSTVFDLFSVPPPTTKTEEDSSSRRRGGQTRGSSRGSSSRGGSTSSRSSDSSRSPTRSSSSSGRMFELDRVGQIIDYFTVGSSSSASSSSGGLTKININTAGGEALMVLPSISWEMVEAIAQRRDQEAFTQPGQITEITGIDQTAFTKIYPLVTTTSSRIHVHSWGRSGSDSPGANAQANVDAIFQVASDGIRVVYWSEN